MLIIILLLIKYLIISFNNFPKMFVHEVNNLLPSNSLYATTIYVSNSTKLHFSNLKKYDFK